jgi:hypothetical protein
MRLVSIANPLHGRNSDSAQHSNASILHHSAQPKFDDEHEKARSR